MSIEADSKQKMAAAIDHFKEKLRGLRTGRAHPALVEGVQIEVYGASMRLKEVATITCPEARQILITPYDAQNVVAIAKGIEKANLNMNPVQEGGAVRISVPPLDEQVRKQIAKTADEEAEKAKISIREVRRKQNELIDSGKTKGEITEDDVKRLKKVVQDLTDKACKEIDTLCASKKDEILKVG